MRAQAYAQQARDGRNRRDLEAIAAENAAKPRTFAAGVPAGASTNAVADESLLPSRPFFPRPAGQELVLAPELVKNAPPAVTTGMSAVPGQMRSSPREESLREITRRVVNEIESRGNSRQAQNVQAKAGLPGADPSPSPLLSGKQSDVRIKPTPLPRDGRPLEEIQGERARRRVAAMERRDDFTYVTTPASRRAAEKPESEQSALPYVRRRESNPQRRMRNPLPGPSVGDLLEESLRPGATAGSEREGPTPVAEGQLPLWSEPANASPLGGAEQLLQEALGRVPTRSWQRDEGVSLFSKKQGDAASEDDPGRPPSKTGPTEYFELQMKTVRPDGRPGRATRVTPAQVSRTGPGDENATASWQQDAPVNAVRQSLSDNETELMSRPAIGIHGRNLRAATNEDLDSVRGMQRDRLAGFGDFGARKEVPIYRTELNGEPLISEDGQELFRIGNPYARDYDAVREDVLDLIPGSRVRGATSYSPRAMLDLLARDGIEAAPANFQLPPSLPLPAALKALGEDAGALDREFGEGGRPDALVIELRAPDPSNPGQLRKGLAVGTRVPGQPGLHWTVPGRESRSTLPILGTDGEARKKAAAELGLDRPNDVFRELAAMANADDPSAPSWSRVVEREVDNLVRGRGDGSLAPEVAIRTMGLDTNAGLGRLLMQKYGQTADAAPAARPARDPYDSADGTAFPVVPIELEDDVRALAMERPELMDSNLLEQMVYGSEREELSGVGADAMDYTDADEALDAERLDYGYGGGSRFDDSRLERSPEELRAQAAARAVIARLGGNRTGEQYDRDAELLAERVLQVAPPAPAALQPDPYGVRTPVGPFKDGGAYAKALKQRRIDELVTLVQTQAAERLYNSPVRALDATPWRHDPTREELEAIEARRRATIDQLTGLY